MPAKKTKSPKTTASKQKSTTAKKTSPKKQVANKKNQPLKAGDCEVTLDRRTQADRREEEASPVKMDRRDKVQRRRQIDPTTCERDYSIQEVEFMNAMDHYKRTSGRMFPTCSEVLEVIRGLGYVQLTPAEIAAVRPDAIEETETENESSNMDFESECLECEDDVVSV